MQFIRTIIEQMEDVQPLVNAGAVRQVRLGFILIDNAAELWLLRQADWGQRATQGWGEMNQAVSGLDEAVSVLIWALVMGLVLFMVLSISWVEPMVTSR